MAEVKRPRRLYLRNRQRAIRDEDWSLAGFWRWKQEAQPGTLLPAEFPLLSRLQAQGYVAQEDLDGADACELAAYGFPQREAATILSALQALLP